MQLLRLGNLERQLPPPNHPTHYCDVLLWIVATLVGTLPQHRPASLGLGPDLHQALGLGVQLAVGKETGGELRGG